MRVEKSEMKPTIFTDYMVAMYNIAMLTIIYLLQSSMP